MDKEITKKKNREKQRRYFERNREKVLEGGKAWRARNKEYVSEYNKQYNSKNQETIKKRHKLYRTENRDKRIANKRDWNRRFPWRQDYLSANSRCNNPNDVSYKNYGARGIKVLMTREDFKELWIRDKGEEMKRAEIHRKNNNGHYSKSNCEYVEGRKHRQIHRTK